MSNQPLTEEERRSLHVRVVALELEHSDLNDVIDRLSTLSDQDDLQLRRLKKKKLMLRDQIEKLRARLIPDIIA